MKKSIFLAFCLLISSCAVTIAQDKKQSTLQVSETEKIIYYTFTGPSSIAEIEGLRKEILSIEGVKEVKSECKSEKNIAQFRILFSEKKKAHEGDKDFDITAIKKLIIKYQFTPCDFKIESPE